MVDIIETEKYECLWKTTSKELCRSSAARTVLWLRPQRGPKSSVTVKV